MAKKPTIEQTPVKMMTRLIGFACGGLLAMQIAPVVPQLIPAERPSSVPTQPDTHGTVSVLTALPPPPSLAHYRERPNFRPTRTLPGCENRPTREDGYMPQTCHEDVKPVATPAIKAEPASIP